MSNPSNRKIKYGELAREAFATENEAEYFVRFIRDRIVTTSVEKSNEAFVRTTGDKELPYAAWYYLTEVFEEVAFAPYESSGICATTGGTLEVRARVNKWIDDERAKGHTVEFDIRESGAVYFHTYTKDSVGQTRKAGPSIDIFGKTHIWG